MNYDYMLHRPTIDELRASFGTLRRALNATQGNIPLACFLIANPDQIDASNPEPRREDAAFRAEISVVADADDVRAAWSQQGKKSIAQVMRETGLRFARCKRLLGDMGYLASA